MTEGLPWPLSVPVLSDGVVTLRAHVPGDVDPMLEMAHDPDMVRFTQVPTPHTREMSTDFALRHVPEGWDTGTARGWAIEAEGGAGPSRFAGNIDLRGPVVADLGYALHPAARGRGIMTRAVRLAADWCFTEGGVEAIHWRAHVGNVASLRVAHACGFLLTAVVPSLLHERGRVLDAWTGVLRFGEVPYPRGPWTETGVVDGESVRLRPMREDDAPRIAEAYRDPELLHWIVGIPGPMTPDLARGVVAATAWHAARGERATWTVADRATDQLLGNVSVLDLAGVDPTAGEIAYWTHPDARDRGVLREALPLAIETAFSPDGLGLRRLTVAAAAGNTASLRLIEQNGFVRTGRQTAAEPLGDGTYADLLEFELLRD